MTDLLNLVAKSGPARLPEYYIIIETFSLRAFASWREAGVARLASRIQTRHVPVMSTVQEIETAIKQLKPKEVQTVADWLQEYREELWDAQIEADAKAGKPDPLIKKAKAGYRAGKATPFP